jgi:hypothetical protein
VKDSVVLYFTADKDDIPNDNSMVTEEYSVQLNPLVPTGLACPEDDKQSRLAEALFKRKVLVASVSPKVHSICELYQSTVRLSDRRQFPLEILIGDSQVSGYVGLSTGNFGENAEETPTVTISQPRPISKLIF